MRKNLSRTFPDCTPTEINALLASIAGNIGRLVAEVIHIPTFAAGRQGCVISTDGADDWIAGKRGQAIFVGAHLGNWELVPILFGQRGQRLTIVYSRIGVETFDHRLLSLRRKTGGAYVDKAKGLRPCVEAMKRGSSLALLIDQRVDAGVEAHFFGQTMLFTPVPVRLALRFGCPIVVIDAIRQGPGHIHATFHDPILPDSEHNAHAEQMLTQRVVTTIEAGIRRHPEQWLCSKRRWAKRRRASDGAISHLPDTPEIRESQCPKSGSGSVV